MVDVHCHVVPGVDDGARDVPTSLLFLRRAWESGTAEIVATPHQHRGRYANDAPRLREAFAALVAARDEAVAAGEELPRLHLGAEVHLDGDVRAEVARGERLLLASGPYFLLELPDMFPRLAVEDLVYRLRLDGVQPILAHPERVGQLLRDEAQLERLVELGALAQVTGSSIAGDFGRPCREATARMLRRGLVHLVASDAHDLVRRTTDLRRARAAVVDLLGEDAAVRLLETNPRAVLEGRPVETAPPPAPGPPSLRRRLAALLGRR
jgi:protein-tyrosine phosphatase